ncbi:centromere protein U [Chaetodon trifascialis]|uniref:centromere protein U n=1 Tax=Chaetodon trifascialis TaxID=109706 RepID=UPI0039939811
MSTKKRRGAKMLKVLQDESQKGSDQVDSPDLSAIERASFLEGLQLCHGNPLHSTAMEEDLNVLQEGQTNKGKAGRKDIAQTLKTTVKQSGAAVKRKEMERGEENEKKRGRKSTAEKVKARPETEGETKRKKGASQGKRGELDVEKKKLDPSAVLLKSKQLTPPASRLKHLVGKKPSKRRSAGQASAARLGKNQQLKTDKKRKSESGSGMSSEQQSHEESDTGTTPQKRKRVQSPDKEMVDEDMSSNPSPKKAKVYSLDKTSKSSSIRSKSRKSSSGSASAEAEKTNADTERRRRRRGRRGETQFEVVLDSFLDFCQQYSESVESNAVKQSIDSFSSNVKEQLLEKISSHKEFKVLKRENAKVASLIRTKTQRLLDAKYELTRAERKAWLLQKEKAELKVRLADLRRGRAFLHDISELNRQYLQFRHKHPKEQETYGASSLPALLLETKYIHLAVHQLGGKTDLKKD